MKHRRLYHPLLRIQESGGLLGGGAGGRQGIKEDTIVTAPGHHGENISGWSVREEDTAGLTPPHEELF